jgi:hypothetical protein
MDILVMQILNSLLYALTLFLIAGGLSLIYSTPDAIHANDEVAITILDKPAAD